MDRELDTVAELFRALGSTARLELLRTIGTTRATVGQLSTLTGLSQPLVSQHLRILRGVGLVQAERIGREAYYAVADRHVHHIVEDAIAHALEATADEKRS